MIKLLFNNFSAGGVFGIRHLQAFLLFLGLTLAYAMRVNLSVAIVAITDRHAANPDFPVNFVFLFSDLLFTCSMDGINCIFLLFSKGSQMG